METQVIHTKDDIFSLVDGLNIKHQWMLTKRNPRKNLKQVVLFNGKQPLWTGYVFEVGWPISIRHRALPDTNEES